MEKDKLKEMTSKVMSELAKIRHKKSPKSKEYYQKISRDYWAKNKGKKKLSPPKVA